MAIVAEKVPQKDIEVREAIAKLTTFYKRYEAKIRFLDELVRDAKELRHEVVTLLNERDMLSQLNKTAAIERERVEREARMRLQTIEQGHQALIDRLSKKEIEVETLRAEVEKRELAVTHARRDAELMKAAYDQKLEQLTKARPKA